MRDLELKMRKNIKKILTVGLSIVLLSALCACDFDETKTNFCGGDLVDVEKLSELKASIITEDTDITETEKEDNTQNKGNTEVNTEIQFTGGVEHNQGEENTSEHLSQSAKEDPEESVSYGEGIEMTEVNTEIETESKTETKTETETEAVTETETVSEDELVYWVEGGKVWHLSTDCRYLKDKENIQCGTVEEAMEAKKTKLCSSCAK